jgi:hypothetical protein
VALALSVASCSQTEKKEAPVVIVKTVQIAVPPEARKPCPANPPKPKHDLTDAETFDQLAEARTTRNVCEYRRAAAIGAIDAANQTAAP